MRTAIAVLGTLALLLYLDVGFRAYGIVRDRGLDRQTAALVAVTWPAIATSAFVEDRVREAAKRGRAAG